MRWMMVALLLSLAPIGCDEGGIECPYRDKKYEAGAAFQDGCNSCRCNEDGSVTCTTEACADCTHEGTEYAVGESWPAGDGCNFCQCAAKDDIQCSAANCGN